MQSRVESIPFGGDYHYVLQTLHGLCSDNGIQWFNAIHAKQVIHAVQGLYRYPIWENTQKTENKLEKTQMFSAFFPYGDADKEKSTMAKPSINDILRRADFTEPHENAGTAEKGNIDKGGHFYHVITQSWGKEKIFSREVAVYRHDLLCKLCAEKGVTILFSVTMPNHTHEVLITPSWSILPEIIKSLNTNVSRKIRKKAREEGKPVDKRPLFKKCPTYAIVSDIVYLFYLGKYIFDNPQYLEEEGRFVPYSCFWMLNKGYFKEPYDGNAYRQLFGMTSKEVHEIYSKMTAKEVMKYTKDRFNDWTKEDNERVFRNKRTNGYR